jgi:MFS family permease
LGKLFVLMVTAFVDMVGLLAVVPLLPFYALDFGANGLVVGLLVSAFSVAQLVSAPFWGRVSDRYGRRPALLIGLTASAIAYVVFAFADSIALLFLSRLIQGAGGGTVGVIQAYVADATKPEDRAKSLGWLSAATNLGVAIGPVLGSLASRWGTAAPGLLAAGLCLVNIVFAYYYLVESHTEEARAGGPRAGTSRAAIARVITHSGEPAPRLIWIYTIAMGAFQGMTAILALFLAVAYGVTAESIGFFFMYIGAISVVTRAFFLGRLVDWLHEAKLARVGLVLLGAGLALLPLTRDLVALAAVVALIPLGTAFTFPCTTALLSRVIARHERGLYMGVQQTFGGVARVIAPIWAGFAWDHLGHAVPFWTGAVMVLASLGLAVGIGQAVEEAPPPVEVPVA